MKIHNKQIFKPELDIKCLTKKDANKLYLFLSQYLWVLAQGTNLPNILSKNGLRITIGIGKEIKIPKESKSKMKGGKRK